MRWVCRVTSWANHGHHLLSTNTTDVSLLTLLLVISKLDNQGTLSTFHHFHPIQLLNGLNRRFAVGKLEKGSALAGPIWIPNHVNLSNLTKLVKHFANIFFLCLAWKHSHKELVFRRSCKGTK